MADLRAERHAQLHTLGEQRIVAAVGRRQTPQPRHNPQPDEAIVVDIRGTTEAQAAEIAAQLRSTA